MLPVKITYPRRLLLWTRRVRKTLQLPEHAEELSLKQTLRLYRLRQRPRTWANQLRATIALLGNKRLFLLMSPEHQNRLRELCQWALGDLLHEKVKLPQFSIRGQTFYAPADRLLNCSFIEFADSDRLLGLYTETGNAELLDCFVATLYRPSKARAQLKSSDFDGDRRRRYNSFMVKVHARSTARLHPHKKALVVDFFIGCKRFICQEYEDLFGQGEEDGSAGDDPYAYIQKEVARSGTLGDLEKVQNENLYNVLEIWRDLVKKQRNERR